MPDKEPVTLGDAIRAAAVQLRQSATPLIDARVLMKHATGLDEAGLIARSEKTLAPDERKAFEGAVERRAAFEPVAYIVGEKEFWSLPFKVSPAVLIPREDSECIVEEILLRRPDDRSLKALDLGTGSGCLLCALLSERPKAFGLGVDISSDAAVLARDNALRLGFDHRAAFLVADWVESIDETFDIIMSNPPYIRDFDRDSLSDDIRLYEPAGALFGGLDGYDAYRAILAKSAQRLAPEGLLAMECGADQSNALAEMVAKSLPDAEIVVINDLQGRPRGVLADRKRP